MAETTDKKDESMSKLQDQSSLTGIQRFWNWIGDELFERKKALFMMSAVVFYWIVRSCCFFYFYGQLDYYKVDRGYIVTSNENIIFMVVKMAAAVAFLFVFNYWIYLTITKDIPYPTDRLIVKVRSRFKRIIRCLGINLILAVSLMLYVMSVSPYHWSDYLSDIIEMPGTAAMVYLLCYLVMFFVLYMGYQEGILAALDARKEERQLVKAERRKKRRQKRKNRTHIIHRRVKPDKETPYKDRESQNKNKIYIVIPVVLLFMVAVIVYIIYQNGRSNAENKTDYKICYEVLQEADNQEIDKERAISFGSESPDQLLCYAIVYETPDQYILCRLKDAGGQIELDVNHQRIIDKDGVDVIYVNDIRNKEEVAGAIFE